MAEMNAAFFEEAKYNLQHGKINFLNVAGLIPEVTEERHVVVRLPANSIRIRHGQHHARRAERGVRDEALDAVEHVAAVHFLCTRARAADVRTALRLRDRHGDTLTAQNARAGGLLLRLRAVGEDRRQAERVGIVRDREAGVMLGQLLTDAVARHGVESQSAVLLRHVQTKQAHFTPFFV